MKQNMLDVMVTNRHFRDKRKAHFQKHTKLAIDGTSTDFVFSYVSLRLRVQNAVPAQPCVGKLGISLVLLNFLHCNFRLWFKTP